MGIKYREFMSLTDEEIIFIMKDIFETKNVDNIIRDKKTNTISCDIYIQEVDGKYDFADTIDLSVPSFYDCGLSTHDFSCTDGEILKWQQWLIAKGCNELFKNNSYIEK